MIFVNYPEHCRYDKYTWFMHCYYNYMCACMEHVHYGMPTTLCLVHRHSCRGCLESKPPTTHTHKNIYQLYISHNNFYICPPMQVQAVTSVGAGNFSAPVVVVIVEESFDGTTSSSSDETTSNSSQVVIAVVVVIVILIIVFIAVGLFLFYILR